jgi:hypothetical protein
MRRARHHSARPLSILLIAFAIALCATATLALPPRAEAVIHLGDPNTVALTNGLVGYWPLDGQVTDWNTNTTRDLSGQSNTGTLVSMSTLFTRRRQDRAGTAVQKYCRYRRDRSE